MGFIKRNITAVTAAPLIEADNGLSRTSVIPRTVKLGQDVAQVGNPAVLLNDREIPMAGFNVLWTGGGNMLLNDTFNFGQTLQVTPDLVVGSGNTANRNHVALNNNSVEVRSNTATRNSLIALTIQDAAFPFNCTLTLTDPGGLGGIYAMAVSGSTIANTGMVAMFYLTGNAFLSNGPLLPDNGAQLQVQGKATVTIGNVSAPNGRLTISPGTALPGTAPINIPNGGVLNAVPISGSIESDGNVLYWTQNTGPTRRQIVVANSFIGSTRIAFGTVNGPTDSLVGSPNLVFDPVMNSLSVGGAPSAGTFLVIGTGTTAKSPYRYGVGSLVTTPVNGNKEFDGTNEFLTAGAVRYTLAKTLTATAVLNFPLTAAQTSSDLTVALTGAVAGDVVTLGIPVTAAADANTCYTAFVAAADLVTVRFNNYSAGGVTPAAGSTFRVAIHKY